MWRASGLRHKTTGYSVVVDYLSLWVLHFLNKTFTSTTNYTILRKTNVIWIFFTLYLKNSAFLLSSANEIKKNMMNELKKIETAEILLNYHGNGTHLAHPPLLELWLQLQQCVNVLTLAWRPVVDGISKSPFGLFMSQEITCQMRWSGCWGVSLYTLLLATTFKNTANETLRGRLKHLIL